MTTGADLGQTLIPTHAGDRDGVLVDRLLATRDSAYSNRWTRTSPKPLSMQVTVTADSATVTFYVMPGAEPSSAAVGRCSAMRDGRTVGLSSS